MMTSLIFFFIMMVLVQILTILSMLIDMNIKMDKFKISPFECGFESKIHFRSPLSIRFFILVVIFLIFDIEVALIMPIPFLVKFNLFSSYIEILIIIVFILFLGIIHEWHEKSLDWTK